MVYAATKAEFESRVRCLKSVSTVKETALAILLTLVVQKVCYAAGNFLNTQAAFWGIGVTY